MSQQFTSLLWIVPVGCVAAVFVIASFCVYLLIQHRNAKKLIRTVFDYLMLSMHVSMAFAFIASSLQLALPGVNELTVNFTASTIYLCSITIVVNSYVSLLYIRSKPIMQNYRFFKIYRAGIYLICILFVLFCVANMIATVVINTWSRSQLRNLILFMQYELIAAVFCLMSMDAFYLYALTKYIKELRSIVESPTAIFYGIIARHGVICSCFSLCASVCGVLSNFIPLSLGHGLIFVGLYICFCAIAATFVRMKMMLNAAEGRGKSGNSTSAGKKLLMPNSSDQAKNSSVNTEGFKFAPLEKGEMSRPDSAVNLPSDTNTVASYQHHQVSSNFVGQGSGNSNQSYDSGDVLV
ncbi:hypothetical protein MIR68_000597 [Amoeboaphelidium protococcarum]|nr:hypothetical protein MIR68_000597 [Amoeboaphelidium protococcarum]